MRYREASPQMDVFSMLTHEQVVTQAVKGINKLSKVIDWELFREELESVLGYAKRDWSKGGRPPFDPVLMFKVLVLQKFHGLSDEECEFQVKDRFSFMNFLGMRCRMRGRFGISSRRWNGRGGMAPGGCSSGLTRC